MIYSKCNGIRIVENGFNYIIVSKDHAEMCGPFIMPKLMEGGDSNGR